MSADSEKPNIIGVIGWNIALWQNLWVGVGRFQRPSSSARALLALCGRFNQFRSPYSWITMRRALRRRRVFDFVPSYLKSNQDFTLASQSVVLVKRPLSCPLRIAEFLRFSRLYIDRNKLVHACFHRVLTWIFNGVYSSKWRLTDRYLRWGTLADPRPDRGHGDQFKSSEFLQELRISRFPSFGVSPTCFRAKYRWIDAIANPVTRPGR